MASLQKIAKHCTIAMRMRSVVAKFEMRQYVQKADWSNSLLAKYSHHTVIILGLAVDAACRLSRSNFLDQCLYGHYTPALPETHQL